MATPFMNLDLPTVSVTLGPDWATDLNTAIETIDSHDHTSGNGAQIPTSGININANLDFNDFSATDLLSTKFTSQGSPLSGASNANSVSVSSGNLYYVNGSGVSVQITSGSSLSSTPSSLSTVEYQSVTSNLVIGSGDSFSYLAVDTTSPRSITLPLASAVDTGRVYIIKDISGQSNTNNITVTAAGSDVIDGSATATLDSNFGSIFLVGDGSGNWYIS